MGNYSQYYRKNREYSSYLSLGSPDSYQKYVDVVRRFLKEKEEFLDVGSGTGQVLELVRDQKWKVSGLEVSEPSVRICRKKGLTCYGYRGEYFPFKKKFFTVVGSFNVLEHTENPVDFLTECLRVLKKSGYLVLVCPNFLALTNDYHQHTRGFMRKINNFLDTLSKVGRDFKRFAKMVPVRKNNFSPDDDAIVITNPLDIVHWSKKAELELIYWSSQENYRHGIINYLDQGVFRNFLGACFFVFRKR